MSTKLLDKLGLNIAHDYTYRWSLQNMERGLHFAQMAGMHWIRPGFNLQPDEFNGADNPWRLNTYKKIQDMGMEIIECAYPQQIRNHLLDSDADTLIDKGVAAYAHIMDRLQGFGVHNFILEAWNEADGKFADDTQTKAQSNDTIIDKYLTFNQRLCEEAHKRGVKFMDLCSIEYPHSQDLQYVMGKFNDKLATYSSKPEYISFHPYCDQYNPNFIPEIYLTALNTADWDNMSGIPLSASEFGFPSEDWGTPFSGKWAFQYSRDVMIRQIIIMDFIGIEHLIIYSGNTNADPKGADLDNCWGMYQYNASNDTVTMSSLGKAVLRFCQDMKGYYLNPNPVKFPDGSSSYLYSNYAFEYDNDNGHKKLFYWNPLGMNTTNVQWNNQTYNLHFTQHVKVIES